MTDQQWQLAWSLYQQISDEDKPSPISLSQSLSGDPEVLEQVRMLLHSTHHDSGHPRLPLPATLQPGDQIGRFVIRELVGAGSFGRVYAARDLELNRSVALKVLHRAGEHSNSRSFREARAASALNHPGIVTIYDVVRTESCFAIAMELVEGETLRSRLARPLSLSETCRLGAQIARALSVSHGAGIIHGDLKPENIMLREDGYIKVLDFGLAQDLEDALNDATEQSHHFAGTLSYMAPELFAGQVASSASDCFALGVLLAEMTAAAPSDSARPPGSSRAFIQTLTDSLLADDAARRPQANEVAHRLDQITLELSADGPLGKVNPRKLDRRKSVLNSSLLLAALVTMIVIVAVWYSNTRRTSHQEPTLQQLTEQISDTRVTAACISPTGKLLAYATRDGVFVQVVSTRETHLLQSPKEFLVDRIRWFPHQDKLLIGGVSTKSQQPSIWVLSTLATDLLAMDPAAPDPLAAAPVQLRTDARDAEISQDGLRIAYSDGARLKLWVSGLSAKDPQLIQAVNKGGLTALFWSMDDSHLAFTRTLDEWEENPTAPDSRFMQNPSVLHQGDHDPKWEYLSVNVHSGQLEPQTVQISRISVESAAQWGQGQVVFLQPIFPNVGGGGTLWKMQVDPHSATPLAKPSNISMNALSLRNVTASADGHMLTALRLLTFPTVFVGNYSVSPPAVRDVRRLTLDDSSNFPHSWTPDSQSVIFESDRQGNNDLFRQNVGSRIAENIPSTPNEDYHANVSPDGRWMLFLQAAPHLMFPAAVWRVPLYGGKPEMVLPAGVVDEFRCALRPGGGCVARSTKGGEDVFYRLDPVRGLGGELARVPSLPHLIGDWALSPLGTEVAIPNHDRRSAQIQIVPLGQPRGRRVTNLSMSGLSNVNGLNWTADGKGWFVDVSNGIQGELLYVDRAAQVTPLLDGVSYAIPSPDGKRVALTIPSVSGNVWRIEEQ